MFIFTSIYETFTLILIQERSWKQVRKKHFKKNAKIYRDDYAKKYSNKVYIGMAVWKGRGDGIKHKVKHT